MLNKNGPKFKFQPELDIDSSGNPNSLRADRGAATVLAYWAFTNSLTAEEAPGQLKHNLDSALPDLICDLGHFCDREGFDIDEAVKCGQSCHEDESGGLLLHDHEDKPKTWTVILMYPDYACDTFGDTWCGHATAPDCGEAVKLARAQVMKAMGEGTINEPDDLGLVAVFEGELQDERDAAELLAKGTQSDANAEQSHDDSVTHGENCGCKSFDDCPAR